MTEEAMERLTEQPKGRVSHLVAAPMGPYVHTIAVPAEAEWLVVSGQTGVDEAGEVVGAELEAQTRAVFRNLERVLADAGFAFSNLVKLTTYLTDSTLLARFRSIRGELYERYFADGAYPASTLVIVSELARPDFLIEIEALAARSSRVRDGGAVSDG
jgi:enamine deaminase RidA (YjgF/YER057c/UK114 family)